MTDQNEEQYNALQRATIGIWGGIALTLSLAILAALVILVLAGLRLMVGALLITQ